MFLELLFLAFIIVFIIDYSGIIQSLEEGLQKWLKMPNKAHIPKPFSCSLCSTWWAGLIYLIVVGQFSFMTVAYIALLAAMTPLILRILYLFRDLLEKACSLIEKVIGE